jgi:hypothetical protein
MNGIFLIGPVLRKELVLARYGCRQVRVAIGVDHPLR